LGYAGFQGIPVEKNRGCKAEDGRQMMELANLPTCQLANLKLKNFER